LDPTHIGRLRSGGRLHLTDSRGWSACSRDVVDVFPIEQTRLKFDDPWCEHCLACLADQAASAIPLFELERTRDEQSTVSREEALAMNRLAEVMADYLEENPPRAGSRIHRHLDEWVTSFKALATEMRLLEIDT